MCGVLYNSVIGHNCHTFSFTDEGEPSLVGALNGLAVAIYSGVDAINRFTSSVDWLRRTIDEVLSSDD